MVSINMKKMVPWRSSPVDLHGTIFGFLLEPFLCRGD